MNKIVLKFGDLELTAKFGIGFMGRYLEKRGIELTELFEKFSKNPLLIVPDMMYNAIIEGTPDFGMTESDFEDLIDEDGGIVSKQLEVFSLAFANSIKVNFPNEAGNVGKPMPKAKKV